MGVSVMDGTIRIRSVAWFATAIVLAVLCTLLVTQAWSAGAAPGDTDSTFVPTAGCRVADTRAAFAVGPRNTPLGADETFTVNIHGENGECTGALAIPTDAVGVALNVTATNATTNSNIRIFPADLTNVPNLSNLNVAGGEPPTPNKVDVKLSPDGKIKIYNFRGSVNIFIDIVGYYTDATLVDVDSRLTALETAIGGKADASTTYSKTEVDALLAAKLDDSNIKWAIVSKTGELLRGKGAVSSTRQFLGFFEVVFDGDLSTCSAIASVADMATGEFNPGEAIALKNNSNLSALHVSMYNSPATLVADRTFTVIVVCP
jgi:hypothetical protein